MAYLTLLWTILYENILPIFLAAGTGYALGRTLKPDLRSVSRLAFYIFSPCLVFSSISQSTLAAADFSQMAVFTLLTILLLGLAALVCGLVLRLERQGLASLLITAIFVNAGNYGLALNKFAFGDDALSRATIYYAFQTLAVYTAGVLIASWGTRPLRAVLLHGLTLPTTYALVGAGVLRATAWQLPVPATRAITLLGQAAVPVMLVLLGLQLGSIAAWPRSRLGLIAVAAALHLGLAPFVGLGLARVLGMTGATYQAAVLESAMPTAVIATILAVEYDLDGAFVTGAVMLSTLLSPVTLTPLIAFLQR